MTFIIRTEADHDAETIFRVNNLAFGRDDEARLVDALRAGGFIRFSLVAQTDGQIVGHVLFSDIMIVAWDTAISALALAPLAVLPAFQRRGIGSELVRRSLELCRG